MAMFPFPDPLDTLDPRAMHARRLAQQVLGLLRDFIPRSSLRDAENELYDAAYKAGARIVTDADAVSYSPPTKGATYGPGQTSQAAAGDPVGTPDPAGHGGANAIHPNPITLKDVLTRVDPFVDQYGLYIAHADRGGIRVSASQLKYSVPPAWTKAIDDLDKTARMQRLMQMVSSRVMDDQKTQLMKAMSMMSPPGSGTNDKLTVDMLLGMKVLAKSQAQSEPKLMPLPAILKLPKEFRAGEVKGWRIWRVCQGHALGGKGRRRLGSLTAGTIWEPGEIMIGDPHKVSTGRWLVYEGVYALKDRARAMHELEMFNTGWGYDSALVLGEVAMWGRIIEHELGYRASHAAVVALHYATDNAYLPELRQLYCPDVEQHDAHVRDYSFRKRFTDFTSRYKPQTIQPTGPDN